MEKNLLENIDSSSKQVEAKSNMSLEKQTEMDVDDPATKEKHEDVEMKEFVMNKTTLQKIDSDADNGDSFGDQIQSASMKVNTVSQLSSKATSLPPIIVKMKRGRKPKYLKKNSILNYFKTSSLELKDDLNKIKKKIKRKLTSDDVSAMAMNVDVGLGVKSQTETKLDASIASTENENQNESSIRSELESSADHTLNTAPSTTTVIEKKKRGRKPKNFTSTSTETPEIKNLNITANVAKKRGRKPKQKIPTSPKPIDSSIMETETSAINSSLLDATISTSLIPLTQSTLKKRGRKPKNVLLSSDAESTALEIDPDDVFNPRLLLIDNPSQLESNDPIFPKPNPPSGNKKHVQCGLCMKNTTQSNWISHLTEHYGIGWIEGEEPKMNLESRKNVIQISIKFMKNFNIKSYQCRICKIFYKSALGAITHLERCGRPPQRFICEHCNGEFAKSSKVHHLRSCSVLNKALEESNASQNDERNEKKLDINDEKQEEEYTNTGRLKRKSLIKAEKKLKEICNETLDTADTKAVDDSQQNLSSSIIHLNPNELWEKYYAQWSLKLKENSNKLSCFHKDCKFETNDIDELQKHFTIHCPLKEPIGFYCTICLNLNNDPTSVALIKFDTKNAAIQHVKEEHKDINPEIYIKKEVVTASENEMEDNYYCSFKCETVDNSECIGNNEDSDEIEEKPSKNKKPNRLRSFPVSEIRVYPKRSTEPCEETYKRWREFTSTNISNFPLYKSALPLYTVLKLNNDALSNMLPDENVSIKFCFSNKPERFKEKFGTASKLDCKWKDLKLLETTSTKTDHLIYTGGPVKFLDWIPLPQYVDEQYLVAACRRNYNDFTHMSEPIMHDSIIFIHKLSKPSLIKSTNIADETIGPVKSELLYAINIPNGPIHCIQMMPSGGYDSENKRLGLLAVGTIKNYINIYSLPLNFDTDENPIIDFSKDNKNFKIIQPQPVFVLKLSLPSEMLPKIHETTQILSLAWSQFSGHQHIFGGLSNGFIAIWNIDHDESNLTLHTIDDLPHFTPLNIFFFGQKKIHSIVIHYDTVGPRWMAASCAARRIVFYDIRDLCNPLIIKDHRLKSIVRNLKWPPVYETFFAAFCDSVETLGRVIMAISPVGLIFPRSRVDQTLMGVAEVDYNPISSTLAACTDNGDVIFYNSRELHLDDILARTKKNSVAVATINLRNVKSQENIPMYKNYDEMPADWSYHHQLNYKEKYAIDFAPLTKIDDDLISRYLDKKRAPPVNLERYTRANAIRFNINSKSVSNLVAVGYETGFIRIINFKRSNYFGDIP